MQDVSREYHHRSQRERISQVAFSRAQKTFGEGLRGLEFGVGILGGLGVGGGYENMKVLVGWVWRKMA